MKLSIALWLALWASGVCHAQVADQTLYRIQDAISAGNDYYAQNYRLAERMFWEPIAGWINEQAKKQPARSILDVGCGYGSLLAYAAELNKARGYCFDVQPQIPLIFASARGLEIERGNVEFDRLPWDQKFDVILFTETLEHLNFNPVPTLRKLHDALTPDGRLYLSTPDAHEWGRVTKYYSKVSAIPNPEPGHQWIDDHIWQYDAAELFDVLDKAGFIVERSALAPGARVRTRHLNVLARPKSANTVTVPVRKAGAPR